MLDGKYHAQQSESFVVLRSSKDIEENEELTINYGNFSNHGTKFYYFNC